MSDADVRVRFLSRKRYPHPDGPKRAAGTELPIRADLARLWSGRGVVKVLDEPEQADEKADAVEAGGGLTKVAITQLRRELDQVEDPAVIRAAMERDDRKTAKDIYAERLADFVDDEG